MSNAAETPPQKPLENLTKTEEELVITGINEINLDIAKVEQALKETTSSMEKRDGLIRRRSDINNFFQDNND